MLRKLSKALHNFLITMPTIKHIKCHAGVGQTSKPILDSRFRSNNVRSVSFKGLDIAPPPQLHDDGTF